MTTFDDDEARVLARAAMQPLIAAILERPEVQAVCLLSSIAQCKRNLTRFTTASDVDLAVVLDVPMAASEWRPDRAGTYRLLADRLPSWVPGFLFYLPMPWGPMEVNVHQQVYQYEADPRTVWDGEKCDTYLNKREILFDRDGQWERLIEAKAQAGFARLAAEHQRLENRITWDVREMPVRQAQRLGPASGHYILSKALDEVLDAIYAGAGVFIPNKKWKLAQLSGRGLIDAAQADLIAAAMRCDPSSMDDLERRIAVVEELCASAGIAVEGPVAMGKRRAFQTRVQLHERPFADYLSAQAAPEIAEQVRDLVSFTACGTGAELARVLETGRVPAAWDTIVPQVKALLERAAVS
ncbi:hypothetical protein AB0A73_21855 [Glycomyces sp. NPDC047369]